MFVTCEVRGGNESGSDLHHGTMAGFTAGQEKEEPGQEFLIQFFSGETSDLSSYTTGQMRGES